MALGAFVDKDRTNILIERNLTTRLSLEQASRYDCG